MIHLHHLYKNGDQNNLKLNESSEDEMILNLELKELIEALKKMINNNKMNINNEKKIKTRKEYKKTIKKDEKNEIILKSIIYLLSKNTNKEEFNEDFTQKIIDIMNCFINNKKETSFNNYEYTIFDFTLRDPRMKLKYNKLMKKTNNEFLVESFYYFYKKYHDFKINNNDYYNDLINDVIHDMIKTNYSFKKIEKNFKQFLDDLFCVSEQNDTEEEEENFESVYDINMKNIFLDWKTINLIISILIKETIENDFDKSKLLYEYIEIFFVMINNGIEEKSNKEMNENEFIKTYIQNYSILYPNLFYDNIFTFEIGNNLKNIIKNYKEYFYNLFEMNKSNKMKIYQYLKILIQFYKFGLLEDCNKFLKYFIMLDEKIILEEDFKNDFLETINQNEFNLWITILIHSKSIETMTIFMDKFKVKENTKQDLINLFDYKNNFEMNESEIKKSILTIFKFYDLNITGFKIFKSILIF
jgi:hypothetical protein